MAEYLIQDTTLDAIADAINAKTGGSSAMTPAEMVTAIGTISGGGGGLNYDLQSVDVTSNYPVVDRAFDNFIFIAQADYTDLPVKADRPRLNSYYIEAVYVDGEFISPGRYFKEVVTETAGADYIDRQLLANVFNVGATTITFSPLGSQNIFNGTWNVIQVELPSTFPFFSFVGL